MHGGKLIAIITVKTANRILSSLPELFSNMVYPNTLFAVVKAITSLGWRTSFTLEQIHRKLKTLPVSRSKFRNSTFVYVSKTLLKHFLAALMPDMKCSLLRDSDFYFSWTINRHDIFYKILVLRWQIAGKCVLTLLKKFQCPSGFVPPGPNPLTDIDRGIQISTHDWVKTLSLTF